MRNRYGKGDHHRRRKAGNGVIYRDPADDRRWPVVDIAVDDHGNNGGQRRAGCRSATRLLPRQLPACQGQAVITV